MTYIVTTVSGQKIDLGAAYSIQINKSKEAPADTLFAIFFSQKIHPEYKLIDVYTSENQLFFSGVVDEQKFEVAENGCFFTIKSRSKAAYLIDNEACAQVYKRPSLDIIFKRHIKPYGFSSISGNNSTFNATMEVDKGMSEWDVLEQFCSSCLGTFPLVNADGSIDASGQTENKKILFSNSGSGINYSYLSQKYNRYKLISEITFCEPYSAVYAGKVKDSELISNGIRRRKFITMSEDTSSAKKISVDTAKQMILDSKKKFNEIVIKCPGAIRSNIGKKCQISDSILGNLSNLIVYEIEYTLNKNGEFTVFTLLEA